MDSLILASLRDAIRENTKYNRQLRDEIRLANLLKALELNLITKNDLINDATYIEYINNKTKKKSL